MTDQLLTAAELAARWECTPATVRNYARAGMPRAGRKGACAVYDPAACDPWRANFKGDGEGAHGGARPGAGRKPAEGVDPVDLPAEEGGLIDAVRKEAAKLKTFNLNLGSAEEIIQSWTAGKEIHPTLARTGLDFLKAANERAELDKRLGKLVDRDEVELVLGEHLNNVRQAIDGLPNRMTAAVMAELAIDPERQLALRRVLEHEVASVLKMLAENPLKEPAQEAKAA